LTVAISCNLSDGVILGVDSAVTLPSPTGVVKVYEEGEKLFQLGTRPIGVATYGLGGILNRTIGSYLREFEVTNPNNVLSTNNSLDVVVEELRSFFHSIYMATIAPAIATQLKVPVEKVPPDKLPIIGFVIGGFSSGSYLSEVWSFVTPVHSTPKSATQNRKQGDFGTNWFSLYEPIQRYIKGYSQALLDDVVGFFIKRGSTPSPLTPVEQKTLADILAKHEYQIPYVAMPIREGLEHVRFLVSMVINHYRFATGAPVVGGKVNIGLVTYKGEQFKILGND
jgi:hypothetical protein